MDLFVESVSLKKKSSYCSLRSLTKVSTEKPSAAPWTEKNEERFERQGCLKINGTSINGHFLPFLRVNLGIFLFLPFPLMDGSNCN